MEKLRSAILEAVPSAQVKSEFNLNAYITSFFVFRKVWKEDLEVTVNDSVIYSKLSTMNFPTISIVKGIDGGSGDY